VRPLGEPFAQFALQDLAIIALRQFFDEEVLLRTLEPRNIVQTDPIEFVPLHTLARFGHDESNHVFAPVGMRSTDNRYLKNCGVEQENLLDLSRLDVHPARDDQVF